MRSTHLAALALAVVAPAAGAQDLAHGRALYETHCTQCHAERLHERDASKVHNLDELRAEVSRWAGLTRRDWTKADVEDVVQHLNATHYRFTPPPRRAHSD
jgi:hypothetical protein